MSVQQQRQLRNRHGASLVSRAMALALAPALYAGSLAGKALQLPLRVAVFWLQLADTLLCDLLACLTRQPGHKAQIGSYQKTISGLQQQSKAQQRQLLLLQGELGRAQLEKSTAQARILELADKVQTLQRQLAALEAAAAAAAAEAPTAGRAGIPASLQQQQRLAAHSSSGAGGVTYNAKGWYLHACVALAAAAVRWWLLHQADPLQRKVMLVVIWPVAWLYGALLFNCVPRSSTLRAAVACCCWALLGYIAHEMVAFSVKAASPGAPAG